MAEQEKKDIVIAAAGGYSWDKIDMWALSLVKSGFSGIGAVIIYDDAANVSPDNQANIENLRGIGFQVVVAPNPGIVFNQRFYDFYNVMAGVLNDLRYAIVTDIRDVYFQADPTLWLEKNLKKAFLACSEGIKYKDESWGRDNVTAGYPTLAHRVMDKAICNVGVLAGEAQAVADLCLTIGMTAKSSGYQVADQSGYNILLDMDPYKAVAQFCASEDGFACQAGTMADPSKIEDFRPYLLEPEPVLTDEGVKTAGGLLYPIVHQYDRVSEWNSSLRAALAEKLKA